MSLAYEPNTNLAFDYEALRKYAEQYGEVAEKLNEMATNLNNCLKALVGEGGAGDPSAGWSTPAGMKFIDMVDENWQVNMKKYVDLLNTLKQILNEVATDYENLTVNYIEKTKLK